MVPEMKKCFPASGERNIGRPRALLTWEKKRQSADGAAGKEDDAWRIRISQMPR
jgi:hypothetical protein